MAGFLDSLQSIPIVGDFMPGKGYDTAAQGAQAAQRQANALSDLQWQRQMAGLGQATGYVNQLQQLYNSVYGPGGGKAAEGGLAQMPAQGGGWQQPPASQMLLATAKPTTPPGQAATQPQSAGWRGGMASLGSK